MIWYTRPPSKQSFSDYMEKVSICQARVELTPMGYELDNLWVTVFTKGKGEIKDLCLKAALTPNN
jgi:hypothetical protein